MGNTSELKVKEQKVEIKQTTGYPWSGDVRIEINPHGKQQLNLKIRVPGWVQGQVVPSDLYSFVDGQKSGYTVKLNGKEIESDIEKGYFAIERTWKKGDVVEIFFDMPPRVVKAHKNVVVDRGRVAFERGPIVYCAEWADNDCKIQSILLPAKPELQVVDRADLMNGIKQLKTNAQSLFVNNRGLLETKNITLTLIPYYSWLHRGQGEMSVWLPQDVSAVKPANLYK